MRVCVCVLFKSGKSYPTELVFCASKAYLSRNEAQTQIACILAEKDVLRSQMMELQERAFGVNAKHSKEWQSAKVIMHPKYIGIQSKRIRNETPFFLFHFLRRGGLAGRVLYPVLKIHHFQTGEDFAAWMQFTPVH